MAAAWKRKLVRTGIGHRLRALRETVDLLRTRGRHYEEIGSVANDRLFRMLMVNLPEPGTLFLDVGCHIGSVLDDVQRAAPHATPVGFEAVPDKIAWLRQAFPDVRIEACAVGESETRIPFFINRSAPGYSSFSRVAMGDDDIIEEVQIDVHPLDTLTFDKRVSTIKIDVEGAEEGVVRGAKALLHRDRPVVFFESGPQNIEALGFTKTGMWKLFDSLDYVVLVPNRVAHADPGLTLEAYLDSHADPRRTTNYIAVPREQHEAFRDRVRAFLGFGAFEPGTVAV